MAFNQIANVSYRELQYSDFKGHGTSAAHTVTNIDLIESETDGRHRFYIQCYLVPSESWINVKTPAVLLHEQYHFTISAAYAHHLKEISYRFQDCDSLTAIAMHNHYNQQMDAWKKEQQDYDDATNHGIDTAAQKTWQLRIDKEFKN